MESIPRAKYISKRAKIILLIKENKKIEVKEELLKTCKEYPGDHCFHDKLSRIYALEENWKLAISMKYILKMGIFVWKFLKGALLGLTQVPLIRCMKPLHLLEQLSTDKD